MSCVKGRGEGGREGKGEERERRKTQRLRVEKKISESKQQPS